MYNVHEVKICSSQRLQTKLSATTTNMYDKNDQFGYELGPLITGLIVYHYATISSYHDIFYITHSMIMQPEFCI